MAFSLRILCNYGVSLRTGRKKRKKISSNMLINATVIYISEGNSINTKCINIIKGFIEVVSKAYSGHR